jgi:hypothetical protein
MGGFVGSDESAYSHPDVKLMIRWICWKEQSGEWTMDDLKGDLERNFDPVPTWEGYERT